MIPYYTMQAFNQLFRRNRSQGIGIHRSVLLGFLLTIMFTSLVGCYAVSNEGQTLSKIGGDLMLNGHSDDLVNTDANLGSVAMALGGNGTSTVYPVEGDIQSSTDTNAATYHLILRGSNGDLVLRLQYDSQVQKFRVVEYFKPKNLSYLGGRWSVER